MFGQHLVMTVTALYVVKTRWAKKGAFVGVVVLPLLIASFRALGPYAAPLW
jgi:hypothetical protein